MPFSDPISHEGDGFRDADRRQHNRQTPGSLSYVHLDENNGGILINLSETGLAVQAAMAVMEDHLPRLRLQMPRSKTWIETNARVVWAGDSRRTVGVEFVDSTEDFRKHLREWLAIESAGTAPAADGAHVVAETRTASIEEMPLRTFRPSAQQRAQALHAPEFEVAELLGTREMANVAVARSMKLPPEHAHAAPATATAPKDASPLTSENLDEKPRQRRNGSYVPLVITLAVLSLAAGWEAGRGNVLETVRALFSPSAASASKPAGPTASAIANGLAANFEVIDSSNQAWLVPFKGPTSATAGPALPALPPKVAARLEEPPATPVHAFKPSNLTAPRFSAHSNAAGGSAAPVVSTPQGGALPGTLAESATNFNIAPPPPAPANVTPTPAVHSSLVEAKLVHTVQPNYPAAALTQRIEGAVKIQARIEEDGSVTNVTALSGSPLLIPAALSAVREWKYKPEMLDGHPMASDVVVTIQFTTPR